jgi:cyanophycinase-like exopeptidase
MRGAVVIVGDSELGRDLEGLGAELLRALGPRRPRVVVVAVDRGPKAVDADGGASSGVHAAVEQFGRLGADVEPVVVGTADDADDVRLAQAIGEAGLIWLSGARTGDVLGLLRGTLVWSAVRLAHERGAIVAACCGAARALSARSLEARPRLGPLVHWRQGLGLVDGVSIVPAYNDRPEAIRALAAFTAPRGLVMVGLDDATALVGRDDAWQVHGTGRVTVWRGRRRERHRAGEIIRLRIPDVSSLAK